MEKEISWADMSLLQKVYAILLCIIFITGYIYMDNRREENFKISQKEDEQKKLLNMVTNASIHSIQKILKNPDSATFEDFKVIESKTYQITVTDKKSPGTLWLVHGVVTAENAFGGRLKNGYCITLSIDETFEHYINHYLRECDRTVNASDLETAKALTAWDHYR